MYWAMPFAASSIPLGLGTGNAFRTWLKSAGAESRPAAAASWYEVWTCGWLLWRSQAQSFIRDKEECLVFSVVQAGNLDRPAECAAEIILPKGRFRRTESSR